MDVLVSLLPILIMIVIFYFLLILPQKKAAQAHEAEINAIVAGDKVETISRVYGRVVEVSDDDFIIDISAGSGEHKIRIHKQGIARVIKDKE